MRWASSKDLLYNKVCTVNDMFLCVAKLLKRFLLGKKWKMEGKARGIWGNFGRRWMCLLSWHNTTWCQYLDCGDNTMGVCKCPNSSNCTHWIIMHIFTYYYILVNY